MNISVAGEMQANSVELSQVQIGQLTTGLIIRQAGCNGNQLELEFGCGFYIYIDERGIRMRREVKRNHDHNDDADLCVDQHGNMVWSWRYTPGHVSHKQAFIEFGPMIVDY